MPLSLLSQLDGLLGLARHEGIDIRPTLLRVLTDLYVQKPSHSPEEDAHYTELALRLIELVDLKTRKAVADRLICYPAAPLAVVRRLAADLPAMAALNDAASAQAEPTPAEALPPLGNHDLPDRADPDAGAMSQRNRAAATEEPVPAIPAATSTQIAPRADWAYRRSPGGGGLSWPITSEGLTDAFFAATSKERRELLLALAHSTAAANPLRPILSDVLARMEADVLAGRPGRFVRDLQAALTVERAMAERIVNDILGEPMVVAAKALSIPLAVLQRILLFLNPAIGHSVERVYSLSALYGNIRREAALRLAAAWRGEFAEPATPPRHVPVLYDDERTSVRRVGEAARRPLLDAARKTAPTPASRQRKT